MLQCALTYGCLETTMLYAECCDLLLHVYSRQPMLKQPPRTLVILQKVRHSTWGTRQAAGNRPHTSLRSSSRPCRQCRRPAESVCKHRS